MGVLQDAIAEARNPSVSVADLLRTCQVLAFRLRHQALKEWVNHELSGYPKDVPIPDYRVLEGLRLKGNFANPRRWIKNIEVPVSVLPEAYWDSVRRTSQRSPIAEIEALVRDTSGGVLQTHPVPPEVYANLEIMEMSTTLSLWCELSAQSVAGLIDQVRTRALTLLLEIELENPAAGDAVGGEPPVPLDRVGQIVQNVIFGGNVMIAAGPHVVAQQLNVAPGDLDSLLAWARSAGVPEADVLALPETLGADGRSLGSRTRGWIERAAKGAAGAGKDVAVGVIEAAVRQYLGLP